MKQDLTYLESAVSEYLDRCVRRLRADLDAIHDAPTKHRRGGAIEVLEALAEIVRDGAWRKADQ